MPLTSGFTTRSLIQKAEAPTQFLYAHVLKFDESQVVREEAGSPIGGRFKSKGAMGYADDRTRQDNLNKFLEMKDAWTSINSKLQEHIDNGTVEGPEANALIDEQISLSKRMFALEADPGGMGKESVGKPGGPKDLVIVGAGPGGMMAGISAGYEGLDTLVVEGQDHTGGQPKHTSRFENVPGFPAGLPGEQFSKLMQRQMDRLGAQTTLGTRVVKIAYDPDTELKTLTLEDKDGKQTTVVAKTVILSGGVKFKPLGVPGSDSASVVYDFKELAILAKDKAVMVIGGSNGAAQAAMGVAGIASSVSILARSDPDPQNGGSMSEKPYNQVHDHKKINMLRGEVEEILKDVNGNITHVKTKTGDVIPAGAVGVFIGGVSDTSWMPETIKRNAKGQVIVNDFETSIPGVYAIGDIREGGRPRVVQAIGEGQAAAIIAHHYIEHPKVPKVKSLLKLPVTTRAKLKSITARVKPVALPQPPKKK